MPLNKVKTIHVWLKKSKNHAIAVINEADFNEELHEHLTPRQAMHMREGGSVADLKLLDEKDKDTASKGGVGHPKAEEEPDYTKGGHGAATHKKS